MAESISRRGNVSGVEAYISAPQVLGVGWNTIQFDDVFLDELGEFDPTSWRFTPQKTGWYVIECQAEFNNPSNVTNQRLMIQYLFAFAHYPQNNRYGRGGANIDWLRATGVMYIERGNAIIARFWGTVGANVTTLQTGTAIIIKRIA